MSTYVVDMSTRHSRAEIKAFLSVETAQVVAKDTRNGELVILRQGQAYELRNTTKEYFECPIDGCANPRLETVGGHTKWNGSGAWKGLNLDRQRAIMKAILESVQVDTAIQKGMSFYPQRLRPVWRL